MRVAPGLVLLASLQIACAGNGKNTPSASDGTDEPVSVAAFVTTPNGLAMIGCHEPDTTAVVHSGDFDALYRAVSAVRHDDGSPVMVSFVGTVEIPDRLTSERKQLWVDRFVSVWPEETCQKAGVRTTLDNTYWKLVELNGVPVTPHENQRETHLILRTQNQQIGGFGGCHPLTGRYHVDGDRVRFIDVAAAGDACDYADAERAFIDALARVTNYLSVGESLQLRDNSGPVARLRAVYMK